MMLPFRRLRSFRFSLRTLLVLTTVPCALLAWEIHRVHERKQVREWLEWRDIPCETTSWTVAGIPGCMEWLGLAWLRGTLGDERIRFMQLPEDLPMADQNWVRRVFPEATVHGFYGGASELAAMSEAEYTQWKHEHAIERSYSSDLERLFCAGGHPPLDRLLAFGPRVLDDQVDATFTAMDFETQSIEFGVDSLLLVAELRAFLFREAGEASIREAQLELDENLRRLQVRLKPSSNGDSLAEYHKLLVQFELARCTARIAKLAEEPAEEMSALSRAATIGGDLFDAAVVEFREERIELRSLTRTLERRRDAKIAVAELTNDQIAACRATQEYRDTLEQCRRKIDALYLAGALGGDEQQYHLVRYLQAAYEGEVAERDGHREAARNARCRALEDAKGHFRSAYFGRGVPWIRQMEAINYLATARHCLAALDGDREKLAAADTAHTRNLLGFTGSSLALYVAGSRWPETAEVDVIAAHYILVRCRLAEESRK